MQHRHLLARASIIGVLVAAVTLTVAITLADAATPRTTFLLSRGADGGFPNGASRSPTVSHDQRNARLMAFESDASNIVVGDANETTDLFVVSRKGPWGPHGSPWDIGQTMLASVGMTGQPANGPSTSPSLDGDAHHAPHCVAFISAASNLVQGDTNGQPDAFVRDLRTNATRRVSVASDGEQANGPTTEVSIDGACERVAFTTQATNLGVVGRLNTGALRSPRKRVYVHVLSGTGADRGFAGRTFLASASTKGAAGSRDSWQSAFARAGKAVVFTSMASNLVRGDTNGVSDVYERIFMRRHSRKARAQVLSFRTRLVSATRRGKAGNGPSSNPDPSDGGAYVAFETTATNLLPGDTNGVSDIAQAALHKRNRVTQRWVSKSKATLLGNGPSHNPTITDAGEFVLFDSAATNLKESRSIVDDVNGVRDVFLWNRPTGNVSLESRAAPAAPGAKGGYLDAPSITPVASSRGNYVAFVSHSSAVDLPLIARIRSMPPAQYDRVYVRYLGEK